MNKIPSQLPPAVPGASQKRLSRRARRGAEMRQRLLSAALRLFAERGFTATTVEDITEAADVGKGTFFNYFPSKEHIISVFGEEQVRRIEVAAAAARSGNAPIRQVLRELGHAIVAEPGQSATMVRSMLQAVLANDSVREGMSQNLERGRKLVAKFFTLGEERGEIRRGIKAHDLARTYQQACFGTLWLWSIEPSKPLVSWLDSVLAVLWAGIAAKPGPPPGAIVRNKRARTQSRGLAQRM